MRDALVFNGASNLDFQDIRSNVIRIPEVIARIREAQQIWDTLASTPLDLANFLNSEDAVFLGNIKLKGFATAVVQVGLLDRYLRSHRLPEFIMGAVNGDSPLQVALGKTSFFDMVAQSPALGGATVRPLAPIAHAAEATVPILAGVQLAEYGIYKRAESGEYFPVKSESREAERMIVDMVDQHEVRKLVMVGPGNGIVGKRVIDLTARDVQVLESIDLDPMLSWFWTNMRDNRLAIAN